MDYVIKKQTATFCAVITILLFGSAAEAEPLARKRNKKLKMCQVKTKPGSIKQ